MALGELKPSLEYFEWVCKSNFMLSKNFEPNQGFNVMLSDDKV
jgi:hypothetical protein